MRLKTDQQGFLMVEVIIATVIVSIALVAVAGMFIQSAGAGHSAADYTTATGLAQKQLELLKRLSADDWINLKNNGLPASLSWQDADESMPVTLNGVAYTVETQAEACSQNSEKLIQVTVTVRWNERGNSRSLQLTTFFPAYKVQ